MKNVIFAIFDCLFLLLWGMFLCHDIEHHVHAWWYVVDATMILVISLSIVSRGIK